MNEARKGDEGRLLEAEKVGVMKLSPGNNRMIYVAGAYRADTENGIFENIMKARKAAHELWSKGWIVICPHMNTAFMDGGNPKLFLDGSLEILKRCDAIYLLQSWKHSEGACEEYEFACELDKEIYFEE